MKKLLLILIVPLLFSCEDVNNVGTIYPDRSTFMKGDVVSVKNATLKCNCIIRFYDYPAADLICEDDNKRLYELEYVYINLIESCGENACDTNSTKNKPIPIEL